MLSCLNLHAVRKNKKFAKFLINIRASDCFATGLCYHRRVSQTALSLFAAQNFRKNSIVLFFRRDLESCSLNLGFNLNGVYL